MDDMDVMRSLVMISGQTKRIEEELPKIKKGSSDFALRVETKLADIEKKLDMVLAISR